MSLALLRRLLVLVTVVVGLLFVAVLAASELVAGASALQRADASSDRLAEIEQIASRLRSEHADRDAIVAQRAMRAESGAIASEQLEILAEESIQNGGGQLLSLQASADDELVRLQWLWRGDEAEMQAALTALHSVLPHLEFEHLRLRRVEVGAEAMLELDAVATQAWRSS